LYAFLEESVSDLPPSAGLRTRLGRLLLVSIGRREDFTQYPNKECWILCHEAKSSSKVQGPKRKRWSGIGCAPASTNAPARSRNLAPCSKSTRTSDVMRKAVAKNDLAKLKNRRKRIRSDRSK
jgi:hypothetical protein